MRKKAKNDGDMTASMRQWTEIRKTRGWNCRRPGRRSGPPVTAACFVLLTVAPAVSIAMLVTNSSSRNGKDSAAAGVGGSEVRRQKVQNVSEHGSNENTCFTAACNDTAAMIRKNMDRSVEPCDNFYRYACGGYLNLTETPDDERLTSGFTSIFDKLHEQIRTSVEADIEPNEPRAYDLVKKFYKSCMNESAIEAKGLQPLLASLRRIGGWPVIEGASWNESNFDWTNAIYELRKAGHFYQHFIGISVQVDDKNSTKHAIYISPPEPRIFEDGQFKYWSDETFLEYHNYSILIAKTLGAQTDASVEKEVAKTTSFEWDLIEILSPDDTDNQTGQYSQMTIAELKTNCPSIPWREYISRMLPSGVPIEENQVVLVDTPSYFTRLEALMTNTSKRVQANYIALTTALNSIKYLDKEMLEMEQQLLAAVMGITKAKPRWKICVESVTKLSFAIESMYASQHLSSDTKKKAASIVDDVKKAYRKMLETANWMDQNTKSRALQKLDSMSSYFAYSDRLSDDELDAIYEELEIDEDNYYENVHKVLLLNTEYSLGKLREPVDKSDMLDEEPARNIALYSPLKNIFVLTAGVLQGAFFSKDRPRYLNYGTLGFVSGHEMTHAFSIPGWQYNGEGVLTDWWQPDTEKEYIKRALCIVRQYGNYTVKEVGLKVNGWSTRDENIADNGGMKAAYLAYNSWLSNNREEQKLPGIDMTLNQLFWMNTANMWCAKYTNKALTRGINEGSHSPNEFRIIGMVSNMPEFAKDFACPVGSKMNPAEKCSLW